MPGFMLHVGAVMQCFHQMAPATTAPVQPRVFVSTQPVAVSSNVILVAGCLFQIPTPGGPKPQPCVKVQWANALHACARDGAAGIAAAVTGHGHGHVPERGADPPGPTDGGCDANAGYRDMNINFPFAVDSTGRSAASADDGHIRQMIEQLLFTSPGERVNRPDFGSDLRRLVFAPNSPELATALQFALQASLQRYLGDLIDVSALDVASDDASLHVSIQYVVRRTGVSASAQFQRAA